MTIKLFFVIFVVVIACAWTKDKLLFVHVLYRHGDRTITYPYPTDPYKDESFWPVPFGQLTNEGKKRQYQLGLWLAKRYVDFLPNKYSANDIYIRSTDEDRTLMSAQANLAGLYSDKNNKCPQLPVIPVHTVPFLEDSVLNCYSFCSKYDKEYRSLLESDKFIKINETLKPVYDHISKNAGMEIRSLPMLLFIGDTLTVENQFNLKLPNWTKTVFSKPLKSWINFCLSTFAYTPALQRLKTGVFFNEILNRLMMKINGQLVPDRKMWIYSAHDLNVASVLMTMGAFDPPIAPPYSSAILFELKQNERNGQYYVETFYKNDTIARPITILNCIQKCPLEKVYELLRPILLTTEEWNMECKI